MRSISIEGFWISLLVVLLGGSAVSSQDCDWELGVDTGDCIKPDFLCPDSCSTTTTFCTNSDETDYKNVYQYPLLQTGDKKIGFRDLVTCYDEANCEFTRHTNRPCLYEGGGIWYCGGWYDDENCYSCSPGIPIPVTFYQYALFSCGG